MKIIIRMAGVAAMGAALMLSVVAHENHDHATGIVKERMDGMEAMDKRMTAIESRLKEKRELSAIKTDAEAIAELSSHVAHLFPPGSTQHPTRARSAIWKNWPDFERRARTMEAASRKLAAADPADAKVLAAQVRALARECNSCHEKYRVGMSNRRAQ